MALTAQPFANIVTFARDSGATRVNAAGLIVGVDFSSTSNTIGTGSRTFTLAADANVNRDWVVGSRVRAVSQAGATGTMDGTVTSYTPSTQALVINVTSVTGSGTSTNWRIGSLEFRRDFDPVTLAPRGGLVEGGATNIYSQSNTLGAFSPGVETTVTGNSALSPDGSTNATLLSANATGGVFLLASGGAATSEVSCFFKRVNTDWVAISNGQQFAFFNIATGNVGNVGEGNARIENYGNGWYRCIWKQAGNGGINRFRVAAANGNTGVVPAGLQALVWGAQNTADSVGSYIPTTTAQVTRAADLPNVDGSRFGQFYRTEGTLVLELTPIAAAVGAVAASINNGTLNNAIRVQQKQSGTLGSIRKMATDGVTDMIALNQLRYLRSNGVDYEEVSEFTSQATGFAAAGVGRFASSNLDGVPRRRGVGQLFSSVIGALLPEPAAGAPFLLDSFPGAAAAYSTRRLNSAYMGAALRVRRSNDNAEQDIGFLASGDFDEAALTTFVGAASGFVTTWYDQSGNARNATQTTAANQPRIVNAGVVEKVNGRASVFYPGSPSTSSLTFPSITPATSTSFNTYMFNSADTQGIFIHGGSGTANYFDVWQQGSGASPADGAISVSQNFINSGVVTPLTRGQRHSVLVTTPALRVDVFTGISGGVLTNVNGYANFTADNAYQSELVFYQADQSANRRSIENNILGYFRIQPSLGQQNAVAFGANTYVTAGLGGSIATFIESGDFVLRNSGTTNTINDVTFQNGAFYAPHTAGIQRSTDGATWTSHTIGGTSFTVNRVTYDGTRHIAVGSGGRYSLSTDNGLTWAASALNGVTTQNLNGLASFNGLTVSCGNAGVIITTTNGTTYTLRTSGTTANLFTVMYSTRDSLWYAAGDNGVIVVSADGATWTLLANDAAAAVIRNGLTEANPLLPNLIPNQLNKVAMRIQANNVAASVNGSDAVVDTTVSLPSPLDRFSIGMNGVNGSQFNGWIRRMRFLTTAESNASLKSLST